MSTIAENIAKVRERIREAAQASQRDSQSVGLLAVSKTKPAAAVREAYAAGQRDFGENYLQEALAKQADLGDLDLVWHFIGPIQSNKTKLIAEHFHWVHSVDRLKIAQRLSEQRPAHLPPLNICLQVNVSEMDVQVRNVPGDAAAKLARQRQVYREIVAACLTVPRCEAVTLWGFTDAHSWIDSTFGADDPLVFDEQYRAKPAFFGMQDAFLGR